MILRGLAFAALLAATAACILTGCTRTGTPLAAISATSSVRQTDDSGKTLPFQTRHSRRWNSANDGTAYEPCTALSQEQLAELGIRASTAADAAGTNGQTLRGCDWRYAGGDFDNHWSLSQFVGNSPGLATSKERRSGGINQWLPDEVISGRQVGVHIYTTGDQCDTYVQSGQASVITMVTHYGRPQPPISEICDRALAFTRATIDKMPL
ncbi:DUF3558 domain-containing protein [Gordonia liuliyuniae]|uniref:DUF3558 domain-containing protein n=1 Tax=Gordonia liuliyuniae TaxID=2911517 RepID=UPI003556A14B